MTLELIKQELGDLINHCTNENFKKGYDPLTDLIDNLDVDFTEEDLEDCNIDSDIYYYNELSKSKEKINQLRFWISNPTVENLNYFKIWFSGEFGGVNFNEANSVTYRWDVEYTIFLMYFSLEHFKDNYSIHKYGGFPLFFLKHLDYLCQVAKYFHTNN